jgi:4-amino-4-deoxy-L-arabinose transferase-like glycosyltransferase
VAIAMGILARRGELQMIPIALAGLGIGCAAIVLLFKGPERRYLLTLFLVAFAVRTVAAVVVHPYLVVVTHDKQGTVNGRWVGFLFEDDRAYHKVAWGLSGYWLGRENGGVDRSDFYLLRMYTYIVAFLYEYVYFASPASLAAQTSDKIGSAVVMAPKLMNCFVGAFAIVPMFALGRELGGSRAGRLVALAAAFWPSLILWSIVNLKDIMVVTLIAAIVFLALRFARRPGLVVAAALLAVFASLENMRLYVFYAFGWLVPIGFFLVNRDPWRRRLAIGLSLTVAIIVIMLAMNQGTQWLGLRYLSDKRLEAIDSSRVFGSDTAESGIELPDRINRYEGGWSVQLRNVPIVLPYVLFAPFPWHASRIRDFLLMPETLAWYGVEVLTMVALVIYGRQRWREYFLPVVFCGGLVFVFSVIEGNVGTIFRHRVMLFPGAFSIAAMGALWIWDGWLSRKILPARPVAPAQAVA